MNGTWPTKGRCELVFGAFVFLVRGSKRDSVCEDELVKYDEGEGPQALTVTVLYAPSPWLPSPEELVKIPVDCMLSKTLSAVIQVDSARPLCPLPEMLPESPRKGPTLRQAFRQALRLALELHLGKRVRPVPDDRIDWNG